MEASSNPWAARGWGLCHRLVARWQPPCVRGRERHSTHLGPIDGITAFRGQRITLVRQYRRFLCQFSADFYRMGYIRSEACGSGTVKRLVWIQIWYCTIMDGRIREMKSHWLGRECIARQAMPEACYRSANYPRLTGSHWVPRESSKALHGVKPLDWSMAVARPVRKVARRRVSENEKVHLKFGT